MSKINANYENVYAYNLDNTYMTEWDPKKYASKVNEAENEELTSSISGNKTEENKEEKQVSKKRDEKKIHRFSSFFKGVGNFFKGMVCDENGEFSLGQTLKTVGIGAAIAAASILIPGAGTVIAYGALAIAAKHGIEAGINLYNAESEEEINNAWENVGSTVTEGALAYAGAKAAGANPVSDIKTATTKGFKGIKKLGSDLYKDYKIGGLREVGSDLKTKGVSLKDTVIEEGKNVWNETKENYNNLNNATKNVERTEKSYDKKINEAKGKEKTNLEGQKQGFKEGSSDKAITGNDYNAAYDRVQEFKTAMNEAKEKAAKKGATKKTIQDAKVAEARYQGAKRVLEDRVNSGDFKKKGTKAVKNAAEKAYNEMTKKSKEYRQARTEFEAGKITKAEFEKVQNEYKTATTKYNKAKGYVNASEGGSEMLANTKKLGNEMLNNKLLTITMAGRGKKDYNEELQYIA